MSVLDLIKIKELKEDEYNYINVIAPQFIWGNSIEHIISSRKEKCKITRGGVKLCTNARKFIIKFSICDQIIGNYPHVGISAQNGITVLYSTDEGKKWYTIECIDSRDNHNYLIIDMNKFLVTQEKIQIIITSPILASLKELYIGIPKNCFLYPVSKERRKKLLFLGGIHTYGIGCTTSAMLFSNIVMRKGDYVVYNEAIKSNDYLRDTLKILKHNLDFLTEIDAVFLEGNYFRQSEKDFCENMPEILDILNKFNFPVFIWNTALEKFLKLNLDKKIRKDIYLLKTWDVLRQNKELYFFSNNFINDAANVILSENFLKLLGKGLVKE